MIENIQQKIKEELDSYKPDPTISSAELAKIIKAKEELIQSLTRLKGIIDNDRMAGE